MPLFATEVQEMVKMERLSTKIVITEVLLFPSLKQLLVRSSEALLLFLGNQLMPTYMMQMLTFSLLTERLKFQLELEVIELFTITPLMALLLVATTIFTLLLSSIWTLDLGPIPVLAMSNPLALLSTLILRETTSLALTSSKSSTLKSMLSLRNDIQTLLELIL